MPRQNNEARTVREPLDSRRSLSSTIRAGSADSYGYARGGYVERPSGAGRDMQALAGALSQFDRSLDGYLDKKLEENLEQGVSRGDYILTTDGRDAEGNIRDWKQLVEAKPEYVNENPWVKKGYEQNRLRALGLDYDKGLKDGFVQSNLVNSQDAKEIDAFVQNYDKQFRAQHKLDTYEDKVLLTKHFSTFTAAAKQDLYSKHSQYLQSQNETLLKQSVNDTLMKSARNMFDPVTGDKTLLDPLRKDVDGQSFAAEFVVAWQDASAKGLLNANVPQAAAETLVNIASMFDAEGNTKAGDEIMNMADTLTVNGTQLSNATGFHARREARERKNLQQLRSDIEQARADRRERDYQQAQQAPVNGLRFGMGDQPLTMESIAEWKDEKGNYVVPRNLVQETYQRAVFVRANKYVNPALDTDAAIEDMRFLAAHKAGTLGTADYEEYIKTRGAERGMPLYEAHLNRQIKPDSMQKLIAGGYEDLSKMYFGDKVDRDSIFNPGNYSDIDAENVARDEYLKSCLLFSSKFEEIKAQYMKEHNVQIVPDEQLFLLRESSLNEVRAARQQEWKATADAEAFKRQAASIRPIDHGPGGNISPNSHMRLGPIKMPPSKEAQITRENHFKQMYPQASLAGINTIAAMLDYDRAQRRSRGEEQTWQDVFLLATGGLSVESLGINTLEQAKQYLMKNKEVWK